MSISYSTNRCEYCNKITAWEPTIGQIMLFSFLLCLLVIPGIIYYYTRTPKCCKQCGFTQASGIEQVVQEKLDKKTETPA